MQRQIRLLLRKSLRVGEVELPAGEELAAIVTKHDGVTMQTVVDAMRYGHVEVNSPSPAPPRSRSVRAKPK